MCPKSAFDDAFAGDTTRKIMLALHRLHITNFLMRMVMPFYGKANKYNPKDFHLFAIGQSHLDTAWNWRWQPDTAPYKLAHTMGYNINNLKLFPQRNLRRGYTDGYKFTFPAAAHYDYVEKTWPKSFARIQELVKKNRWELVGGMWVETDGNVPDGESFVRQCLYGQRYFLEKFGKKSVIGWLPDTFGFCWTLPQIFLKAGMPYFYTTKMTWNRESLPGTGAQFPFGWFDWQSPDGSRVLSYNYQNKWRGLEAVGKHKDLCRLVPAGTSDVDRTFNYSTDWTEKHPLGPDFIKEVLWAYGEGDGGHGPLQIEIMVADACEQIGAMQQVKAGVVYKLIDHKYRPRIPIWNDELYLEVHRGVQTTLHRLKAQNRWAETHLQTLEKLLCVTLPLGMVNPKADLDTVWKAVLFNQFHDILPGSSIQEVYEDSDRDFREIITPITNRILDAAIETLRTNLNAPGNSYFLFSPHHWSGMQKISLDSKIVYRSKASGIGYEILTEEDLTENLPSNIPPIQVEENAEELKVQNPHYTIVIDKKTGILQSMQLPGGPELLAGHGNCLRLFGDEPTDNDAWEIDTWYRTKPLSPPTITGVRSQYYPNRFEIVFTLTLGEKSSGSLLYRMTSALPYIECELDLDFQEAHKLLRVEFDTAFEADKYTTGLPYGSIDRPTKPVLPLQKGRWEVPGNQFLSFAAPDGSSAITILLYDRNGMDAETRRFGVSLLRGPSFGPPDEKACFAWYDPKTTVPREAIKDLGKHQIRWGILPHRGDWKQSNTKIIAHVHNFNYPPFLLSLNRQDHSHVVEKHFQPLLPFLDIEADNVSVSILKPSYDGVPGTWILRVVEWVGKETDTSIHGSLLRNSTISECDLLEFSISPLVIVKDSMNFHIKPYEIKSFRIEVNYEHKI
jgi:alpha-mannosidase